MKSILQMLAFLVLATTVSTACGQQPSPVATPSQPPPNERTNGANEVRVFSLRNVDANSIQSTLYDLYGPNTGFVASAQPRTNQLVVVGTKEALQKVETLLDVLDQKSAEPVMTMLSQVAQPAITPRLAQSVAEAAQVDLSFDEDLGVMMVRSDSEERVKRFTEVLERLSTEIQENSNVAEREVLVRVSWLMPAEGSEGTGATKADAGLKDAIDKLATMGYSDLVVAGQLMTRCSISSSSATSVSEFEAEGHTADGFDLGVRGHFNGRSGRTDGSVDVNMSVFVKQANKAESNNDCLLSVVLKLKEGKPIILGSAPVAGAQSFFVVQFIAAE